MIQKIPADDIGGFIWIGFPSKLALEAYGTTANPS
jgi:hypothetical protein